VAESVDAGAVHRS